jgi:hypothetical protein
LVAALDEPEPDWAELYGTELEFDAADAVAGAAMAAQEDGEPFDWWRFAVLQSLDYYDSAVKRGGIALGAKVFEREPALVRSPGANAAIAALAEHLSARDGWETPRWAFGHVRTVNPPWFVVPEPFRQMAQDESPVAFRGHGVLITGRDLNRA